MPAFMPRKLTLILIAVWLALPASLARSAEPVSPDDTARFLAGLSPSAGSPLAGLTNDGLWREHAHYFDSIFEREDAKLSKVRAFSQSQLTDKHDALLYFFSGPDFLYATNLFPNASTYVLAGLEPAGDIPQLTNLSRPAVAETLHNLENSLGTILNYSFIITQKMKTQLSTGPVYGTLPVLYVFMARTGKTIHEVNFVGLDAEGNVEDLGPVGDGRKAMRSTSAAKGVKIVFSDGSGRNQTLYYFSTNLADDGVRRSGFLAFCAKLGPSDAFIKSASYLLHGGGFSAVRSFLLQHSALILEDDSGIPLAYFDPKKWRLQPYGRYVGPLNIFGRSYQPGMAELFRRDAKPIDFGIGYRWQRNESNLLLAEKTAAATSDGENAPAESADHAAPVTDGPPHKPRSATNPLRRKRVESDTTGSIGCPGIRGLFSFCSDTPPKSNQ
jgi:hypothetical protein